MFHRQVQQAFLENDRSADLLKLKLIDMKHEVDNMFADIRLRKRTKLRSRLLKEDKSRKKFWQFVKSQAQMEGYCFK